MKDDLTFIEVQLPVSKLSKESYKERKSHLSQTITSLGKWWGRKPLILVRAIILGILLPNSNDQKKDRDIFLKILTMDNDGLLKRKTKLISPADIFNNLTVSERIEWFEDRGNDKQVLKKDLDGEKKYKLQTLVFNRLSYDQKLKYCDRPEQIEGLDAKAWEDINGHLGTNSSNLPELINELGVRRFGRVPRIGDAFCGGGSIPFEAARIGCETYASDLNPVAALLTWGALNIIGGGEDIADQVRDVQEKVFSAVDKQISEWGIEHNEKGWRADAYLYCVETKCPECGWKIPLAPTWVVGQRSSTVAELIPDDINKQFNIEITQGVSKNRLKSADKTGTVIKSRLECPHCGESTSMSQIRGDRRGENQTEYGLRLWENSDLIPRPDDVFQERLYCIRWIETCDDNKGKIHTTKHYLAPTTNDAEIETKVLSLLTQKFDEWQKDGYIPCRRIEHGDKTDEPIRTRGWTYWHHLFTPRQLLIHGLISSYAEKYATSLEQNVDLLLSIGRLADWDSKLCRWGTGAARESIAQTFANQALNTFYNYPVKALRLLKNNGAIKHKTVNIAGSCSIAVNDARLIETEVDIWCTDPPYADAINYHELSELPLSWYDKRLTKLFPEWYSDSKRAIAIRGSGKDFRLGMVDVYSNLSKNMPNNGLQVVMFTHQNAGVWADLTLILWASGLHVTAAWTIATETESALKEGNYVQGTVIMILRKQQSEEIAFLDEVVPEVEAEVERQLESMLSLEDKEDPNFSDSDYQLAAYAAALRILTQYKNIEDIDVNYELSRERSRNEVNPIERLIENAVKTASNYLVPKGLADFVWKRLLPEEKLYLKGLEVESHGEFRTGVYQEFARGFGVRDYQFMIKTGKANQTRLKTASEFKRSEIGDTAFGNSLVRHALYAIYQAADTGETQDSMTWLHAEVDDYWSQRETIGIILRFILSLSIKHWEDDTEAASLVAGTVENDHI